LRESNRLSSHQDEVCEGPAYIRSDAQSSWSMPRIRRSPQATRPSNRPTRETLRQPGWYILERHQNRSPLVIIKEQLECGLHILDETTSAVEKSEMALRIYSVVSACDGSQGRRIPVVRDGCAGTRRLDRRRYCQAPGLISRSIGWHDLSCVL